MQANGTENEIPSIDNNLTKEPASPYPSADSIADQPLENEIDSKIEHAVPQEIIPAEPQEILPAENEKDKSAEKTVEFSTESPVEVPPPDMDRIPEEESDASEEDEDDDEEDTRDLEGKTRSSKGHEVTLSFIIIPIKGLEFLIISNFCICAFFCGFNSSMSSETNQVDEVANFIILTKWWATFNNKVYGSILNFKVELIAIHSGLF